MLRNLHVEVGMEALMLYESGFDDRPDDSFSTTPQEFEAEIERFSYQGENEKQRKDHARSERTRQGGSNEKEKERREEGRGERRKRGWERRGGGKNEQALWLGA
mmetsp:Transcript_8636/g.19575  ORF Transcript_8636/g.19575 Transcript_8636/m.19575 type:complete len:104 (-) Transcript_8636:7-318(-)